MAKRAKTNHILVIRLSAMGDVAMTIPIILSLKERYPEVKISVLTKVQFTPIFSNIEGVSVYGADVKNGHKGIVGIFKLYRELRPLSITHVANLHGVLRSNLLTFIFKCSGAKTKTIHKGRAEKKALTRLKNKIFIQLKSTIQRYEEVFKNLGFNSDTKVNHTLAKAKLNDSVLAFLKNDKNRLIGIAPFASHEGKIYRLDLMEKVIDQLSQEGNNQLLLLGGGKHEIEALESLSSKYDDTVQSVAGKLKFIEELDLISHLSVMIAMDSGNAHLAANYGVPVVTIWGVTHPFAGFAPYNQPKINSITPSREKFPLIPTSVYGNRYPKGYEEAINSITPETIVKRVSKILGES